MTEYKSQIGDRKYAIQFETEDHYLYAKVQQACREAIDSACGLKLAKHEEDERGKGCEWCDDHNYKQPSDWIWGERIHIIKPHYFCVGDGIAHYEEAEYCPKCGRKLVSEE